MRSRLLPIPQGGALSACGGKLQPGKATVEALVALFDFSYLCNNIMRFLLPILLLALCGSCSDRRPADTEIFYVSIPPLRGLVGDIVGGDFQIEVLVPPGASPETFEPTPKQFIALNRARLVFNVGLIDFETTLLSKIEQPDKVIDLSRGIELIDGGHQHTGSHGVDPHIWCSPKALQLMAQNAYEAIHRACPDSTKYTDNYNRLQMQLTALDERVQAEVAQSGVRSFIIYHPALGYYARDYGLRQTAIEEEGKEPSAKRLTQIIDEARKEKVRQLFYERQFPRSTVEVIARDIGAQCVEIDPMREDIIANIDAITDLITKQ